MIVQKYIKESESDGLVTLNRSGAKQRWFRADGSEINMKIVDTVVDMALRNISSDLPPVYKYINSKDIFYTDSPYVDTMATDGRSIFINPSWVDYTLARLGGPGKGAIGIEFVIIHEALHNAFHHTIDEAKARDKYPDHDRVNRAQDYEVNYAIENYLNTKNNPDLYKGITKMMEGWYDEKFADMTWENIYPEIPAGKDFINNKIKTSPMFKKGFRAAIKGYFKRLRKEKLIEQYEVK